jgi:RimJ/RimL family protein N-acetyltransferase
MYRCLTAQQFDDTAGFTLLPLRFEDIESIRIWRNAQIDILRQKTPINSEQQIHYYNAVIKPSFSEEHPSQILFSLLKNNICIGYGGLVHVNWEAKHAEISFLLNPSYVTDPTLYRQTFSHYLSLLSQVAFLDLYLHRLYAETYEFRVDHIATLESAGFEFEGRLREHIFKRGKWEDSLIHGLISSEEHS